jgi:2-polyprenyl-3-methyl-5-hydroxy-6-metoxy-1,4-benzoquinol methylase
VSSQPPDASELVQAWDAVAEGWAERVRTGSDQFRQRILDSATLAVLGDVAGKTVLDAGCGEGRFARMLAERGADVTAVDFSPAMIELAQKEEQERPLGVSYQVADLADLSCFSAESFDVAVAYLCLIDLADHEAAIAQIARLLKPGGQFVFSLLHPCFTTKGSGWMRRVPNSFRDADKLYYKVDNYFERSQWFWKMWPTAPAATAHFHRTLSDYAGALRRSGFLIRDLLEPTPDPKLVEQLDYWREYFRVAYLIIFDCVKAR